MIFGIILKFFKVCVISRLKSWQLCEVDQHIS